MSLVWLRSAVTRHAEAYCRLRYLRYLRTCVWSSYLSSLLLPTTRLHLFAFCSLLRTECRRCSYALPGGAASVWQRRSLRGAFAWAVLDGAGSRSSGRHSLLQLISGDWLRGSANNPGSDQFGRNTCLLFVPWNEIDSLSSPAVRGLIRLGQLFAIGRTV